MAKRNVTNLLDKINSSPSISAGMRTDNKIYALVNGVYEDVAPAGCNLIYQNPAAASTLEAPGSFEVPVPGFNSSLIPELGEGESIPEPIKDEEV